MIQETNKEAIKASLQRYWESSCFHFLSLCFSHAKKEELDTAANHVLRSRRFLDQQKP